MQNYPFNTKLIPKYSYEDENVTKLISENKPVVITGTQLAASALKWDLSYLEENIGEEDFTVFSSDSHIFKYYDDAKITNVKDKFVPPFTREKMLFKDFSEKIINWKPGDKWLYLQTPLSSSVGPAVVQDFLAFNWNWINSQQTKHNWGPLTSNLLLIAKPGSITPVHYDEQENFFAQLRGTKRCILFPPEQFECLYPHPVYHPHDRQSQVNFSSPDYNRFPKFKNASGYEAIVNPGDVIYIPMYWWHHIESLQGSLYTASVNFWYKSASTLKIEYPLTAQQKVAMMRNVEKILLDALLTPNEVSTLLNTLVSGRFN